MPYVTISTVRGILDAAQKKALLDRVTDLLVEIEGQGNADFRRNVWVRIEEQDPSHWSLGGMQPTAEIIAGTFGTIGADGLRIARQKA
ncbi:MULTISPECIES: tautomerase family protein [Bradyrhizobium]|uniref:4-oxalocrotonate tautomerase family protein n=2 Tax=Bradyrhizobium TaxID=374 RepID=A0A2U8QCG9_9BRAD|nr:MULTISPECIES: 4-oxalocrotonate tautomerase family protein [Bradyrhizobium]AWM01590.1 4-oxalocrotonate tautomerase [Bradyrhizobium amphicarpaeae]AWM07876.1 4-oxalocrotonate tautomerase [Bradyrhizobium symbiodeficiens]QDF38371.1 4-oxalocrotonate tautomerase family protein [Bradyrhizobium symbiodeficiens]QIP00863.1 4-oxalocrotonate tautomerase family protein [Bradyrhizobium symbiodeficiens]QIP09517.1 4-oxalocrotonate tautomerase family protein [Bradyrhizobium symbiodeficiens]